jgi:hypothetical protein
MSKHAIVVLLIGSVCAWGQAQKDTVNAGTTNKTESAAEADKTQKVDKADAYYHFMLAQMYADQAATSGNRNPEYASKAREEMKAAVKADPQVPATTVPAPLHPTLISLPAPISKP